MCYLPPHEQTLLRFQVGDPTRNDMLGFNCPNLSNKELERYTNGYCNQYIIDRGLILCRFKIMTNVINKSNNASSIKKLIGHFGQFNLIKAIKNIMFYFYITIRAKYKNEMQLKD